MALIKIYSEPTRSDKLQDVARSIKLICSAALNCDEIPTSPEQVETVSAEGIDLIGIDYIIEVIACERPNMQEIGDAIIAGMNAIYPDKLFSVYFNIISDQGMSATPRQHPDSNPISMEEAINLCKKRHQSI